MTNDQLQFQLEMSSNIHFNDDIKKIMIIVTKIKKTKQSKSKLAKILFKKTVNNKTRLVGEQTIGSCIVGFNGNAGFTLCFRFQVIVTRYSILRGGISILV